MKVEPKYGKGKIRLDLPDDKIREILRPKQAEACRDPIRLVGDCLDKPLASQGLAEVIEAAGPDPSVAITIEDHTRPVPTRPVVIPLLEKLSSAGVAKDDVTFIVATGIHRDLNKVEIAELRAITGEGPKLLNHHADRPDELTPVGKLTYPDGTEKELSVNRELFSADVTILTGDVEFHQLFGYGGGAKSVLPGTADAESVRFNHSLMDIPESRSGNLDNPLRTAAERAADLAGVDFSVNLVLNQKKEVIDCYAGDVHRAFEAAVARVDEQYKVPYREKADLVIVEAGGYPKDIDLYQAQKAVENGLELVKTEGDLALIAQCPDGWGSPTFREWVNSVEDLEQTEKMVQERFEIGGHKAYIYAREKRRANLYLLSDLKDSPDLRKIFTPITREGLEEMAREAASVSLLELGSSTVPIQLEE